MKQGASKGDSAKKSRFAVDDARWRKGKGDASSGKVRLDARFADLFTNPDFAETFELDPLGRRVKPEESTSQRLRRVYTLSTDEQDEKKEPEQQEAQNNDGEPHDAVPANDGDATPAEAEAPKKTEKVKKETKKAVAAVSKKAANKKKQAKKAKPDASIEEDATAAEEEAEEEGQETRRLAVCRCDWDKVRAVDILVLLQSFVPATGAILSVTVYPSRLGQQRLEEEATHGPRNIFRTKRGGATEIDEEKLRQYELSKLDYYYAVVECDSVATAAEIYKTCDGLEFERSSNVLDLSFIPDDVTFDLPPRETAREVPSNYQAPSYYTSALQHSKVELTWDAEDTHRTRIIQKARISADELKMSDFKAYLASDSDESDEDEDGADVPQLAFVVETPAGVDDDDHEEQRRAKKRRRGEGEAEEKEKEKIDPKKRDKYKALLGAIQEDEEEQQDMEITFVPGLSEKVQSLLDAKDNPDALKKKRKREAAKKKLEESEEDSDFFAGEGEIDEERGFDDYMGAGDEEEGRPNKKGRSGKKQKVQKKKGEEERKQEAELALLALDEDLHSAASKRTADASQGAGAKPRGRKAGKNKAREEAKAAADLDLQDPRFRELVTSPEFAIDPTRLKKNSQTVNKIQLERSRMRAGATSGSSAGADASSSSGASRGGFSDSSLSALVSSVKVKGLGQQGKGRKTATNKPRPRA